MHAAKMHDVLDCKAVRVGGVNKVCISTGFFYSPPLPPTTVVRISPAIYHLHHASFSKSTHSSAKNYTTYTHTWSLNITQKRQILYLRQRVRPKRRYVCTRAYGVLHNTVVLNCVV